MYALYISDRPPLRCLLLTLAQRCMGREKVGSLKCSSKIWDDKVSLLFHFKKQIITMLFSKCIYICFTKVTYLPPPCYNPSCFNHWISSGRSEMGGKSEMRSTLQQADRHPVMKCLERSGTGFIQNLKIYF